MKKFWKILGIAALAASVPYAVKRNEENGEVSVHALLWNVRLTPDPEDPKRHNLSAVNIGSFSNPFAKECCCGGHCGCHCHDEEEVAEEIVEEVSEEVVTPEDFAD